MKKDGAAIRAILNRDWDPIGGAPEDEYDGHVWPVYRLLVEGDGQDRLSAYLRWAAEAKIGCPAPEERLAAAVEKLLALDVANRRPPAGDEGAD